MKGIILAGGLGTRLFPLTKITNKHLLPIYNKPMIYYPLQKLVDAGIEEIMIVTGGYHAGDFLKLLGNGKEFGLRDLHYTYQEGEGGIADALKLTEHFVDGEDICVILGDNIIEDRLNDYIDEFQYKQRGGAKVLLKEVTDPGRYGVAEINNGKVISIEEKPKEPKSNFAVTGIYMYDYSVFDKIKKLKPSGRGELEITDVNNSYMKEGNLTHNILLGFWSDAGTFDSLILANRLVYEKNSNIR